jgi:large subunit ribosomal protein L19
MDKLTLAEQTLVKEDIPAFKAGDTVNVYYRVREGDKERIQQFKGVVLSRRGSGPNETFTCRKISFGNIGVERIFLIHSPFIAKIDVEREGDVRRSKLYYLRDRQGKAARVKEKERHKASKAKSVSQKKAEEEKEHDLTDVETASDETGDVVPQMEESESEADEEEFENEPASAQEEDQEQNEESEEDSAKEE